MCEIFGFFCNLVAAVMLYRDTACVECHAMHKIGFHFTEVGYIFK